MIRATIIADSVPKENRDSRITTFELEYPRFVHAELMTHRLFSRNAASSRAIPFPKMLDQVRNDPAHPVEWGLNQAGMQAKQQHSDPAYCLEEWKKMAQDVANIVEEFSNKTGLHKQIVNRPLEAFQWMKTIVTATEFDNFFWLRCHTDAQPEIHVLAEDEMYKAYQDSTPQVLQPGEWHLPYVATYKLQGKTVYTVREGTYKKQLPLEQALKISSSCCAQVSYRALDDSLEKAEMIYDRLVNSVPVHSSPFEHQATPMGYAKHSPVLGIVDWEEGVTHCDKNGDLWSGNLKGWIQHRQLIPNNVCNNYETNEV